MHNRYLQKKTYFLYKKLQGLEKKMIEK